MMFLICILSMSLKLQKCYLKQIIRKIVIEFWDNIRGFLNKKMKKKEKNHFFYSKFFLVHVDHCQFSKNFKKYLKNFFTRALIGSKLKLSRSLEFILAFFKAQQVINVRGGGAHLCFMAFAFHFQILGQFSIFVKLSTQGVK